MASKAVQAGRGVSGGGVPPARSPLTPHLPASQLAAALRAAASCKLRQKSCQRLADSFQGDPWHTNESRHPPSLQAWGPPAQ